MTGWATKLLLSRAISGPLAIFQGLCSFAYNVYHGGPTRDSGQNYISLGTFRKNGSLVHTPVWLYVMMATRFGKIQLCAE